MRRKKVYVHYGASRFDKSHPLGGGCTGKPDGLWASPKYSAWGWRHWCICEDYKTESLKKCFRFRLTKDAKIFNVRRFEDILPYLSKSDDYEDALKLFPSLFKIDPLFQMELDIPKIKERFDGMEIFFDQNYSEFHDSALMDAFSVDSIVVWNLDKIICL